MRCTGRPTDATAASQRRCQAGAKQAQKLLTKRGKDEAKAMVEILEAQRRRIEERIHELDARFQTTSRRRIGISSQQVLKRQRFAVPIRIETRVCGNALELLQLDPLLETGADHRGNIGQPQSPISLVTTEASPAGVAPSRIRLNSIDRPIVAAKQHPPLSI